MEELSHSSLFWLVVGACLLSACVLGYLKLRGRFDLGWHWVLTPLVNWAVFCFWFFFVFIDGLLEKK